jgi:hypothetical protein
MEREVRGLKAWQSMHPADGYFVWLLANTNNERCWILRKPLDADAQSPKRVKRDSEQLQECLTTSRVFAAE